MLLNMKKQPTNLEVIAEQKEEIRAICKECDIPNTTSLARAAELVPSTINRFMNSEAPKSALSSITMAKLRAVRSRHSGNYHGHLTEREIGFMGAFQIIFAVLTQKLVSEDDLKGIINHQIKNLRRQGLPAAIEVTEELLNLLDSKPRESSVQAIRKLLPPHQAESV